MKTTTGSQQLPPGNSASVAIGMISMHISQQSLTSGEHTFMYLQGSGKHGVVAVFSYTKYVAFSIGKVWLNVNIIDHFPLCHFCAW